MALEQLTSHAVALVLLPPPHIAAVVDTLRSANDKSWPRWSAHITVLFPLGTTEALPQVVEKLRPALASSELQPFHIQLDRVGRFATADYETVYLGTSNPSPAEALWSAVVKALNYQPKRGYIPHMTLGQTARNSDSIAFLTDKGNRLLERQNFRWLVDHITLLRKREDKEGAMEVYAQIPVGPHVGLVSMRHTVFETPTYHFNGSSWVPTCSDSSELPRTSLTVATYNILHHTSFPLPTRFPAILDALLASHANVAILQEVDDESLSLILQNERIRERWTWCSRSDSGVLESERNVIMLAMEEFGFSWVRVELGGKHKACTVARLRLSESQQSIVIAGVHLSAGRTPTIVSKRNDEITTLLSYLRQHHAADDWIVVGDVNWPQDEDFPNLDILVDVWAETIGDGGSTYDPTRNPLASATAKQDRTPERYDRLFVKRNGRLVVYGEGLELFGFPQEGKGVGSDHWGLRAVVHFLDNEGPKTANAETFERPTLTPTLQLLPTAASDDQLRELCAKNHYFPSDAQNIKLQKALDALRGFLINGVSPQPPLDDAITSRSASPTTPTPTPAVRLVVVPVGSFAMGYHTADSDVDCFVIGNINTQTFWRLMRWKIRAAGNEHCVRLRRFVKDALVQMMVLDVDGVKIDLQYCPAAKLAECWDDLHDISRDSPLFSLPVSTLRTLNAHRDALALLSALPSLDTFRLAHRALRLFFSHKGILGARFGYLGGFHLAFLLANICFQVSLTATAAQLVRMFFRVYAHWDWDNNAVTLPIPGMERPNYRRSKREPMVVLSLEKPRVNMCANANPNSVEVLKTMLVAADQALQEGSPWDEICGARDGDPPFWQFVKGHKAFVKIDVSYWGDSCMRGRRLIGWLESRFVGLLVQLHANTPTILAHLWPARFADGSTADPQSLDGFYLIGLSSPTPSPKSDEERQNARNANANIKNSLAATLRAFESDILSNTRYYHSTEMFVSVTDMSSSDIPPTLLLDTHRWSDGGFDGFDEDDDDSDSDIILGSVDDEEEPHFLPISALKKKRTVSKSTPYLPGSKLRKSIDVYNRLIWDPVISKDDYVIGYEDRFAGIKEIPLGSWNRQVEDEAFIPFHRVVHFKRKSDNVTVWDRKTKTDLVFGSGIKTES